MLVRRLSMVLDPLPSPLGGRAAAQTPNRSRKNGLNVAASEGHLAFLPLLLPSWANIVQGKIDGQILHDTMHESPKNCCVTVCCARGSARTCPSTVFLVLCLSLLPSLSLFPPFLLLFLLLLLLLLLLCLIM